MKIIKKIKGEDGVEREWLWDTEKKLIAYKGIARDFQEVKEDDRRGA